MMNTTMNQMTKKRNMYDYLGAKQQYIIIMMMPWYPWISRYFYLMKMYFKGRTRVAVRPFLLLGQGPVENSEAMINK